MTTTLICVELLDEGTPTWIETPAELVSEGVYRLGTPRDYDPEDYQMQYLPGSLVQCELAALSDGPRLVAVAQVEDAACSPDED